MFPSHDRGGLDTDLECRALLAGKNVFTLGFGALQPGESKVSHYHLWHSRNMEKMRKEGFANQDRLHAMLNEGNVCPNDTWGEYESVPV